MIDNETDELKKNDYNLTLNSVFKQPIDYCKKVYTIDKHIQTDLELIESEDAESDSVYNNLVEITAVTKFNTVNILEQRMTKTKTSPIRIPAPNY